MTDTDLLAPLSRRLGTAPCHIYWSAFLHWYSPQDTSFGDCKLNRLIGIIRTTMEMHLGMRYVIPSKGKW